MVTYLFETHITYVDQGKTSSAQAAFNGDDPKFIQTHVVDGRVIFEISCRSSQPVVEENGHGFAIGGKVEYSPWTHSIDHLMDMANLHDLYLHPVVLTLPDIWGGGETLVISKRDPLKEARHQGGDPLLYSEYGGKGRTVYSTRGAG